VKVTVVATIEALFPELHAAHAQLSARGRASSPRVAIHNAFRDLLSNPHVKGRRYTTIKATISIAKIKEETPDEGTQKR
jgi:hypothetical protein